MSAKKKDKSEWVLCASCESYVTRTNLAAHQNGTESNDSVEHSCISTSPYVSEGKFAGSIAEIGGTDIICPGGASVILLHPSTMKLLDVLLGSYVVVQSQSSQRMTYCSVWPSSKLRCHSVQLSSSKGLSLQVKEHDEIIVSKLQSTIISASVVELETSVAVTTDTHQRLLLCAKDVLSDPSDCPVLPGDCFVVPLDGKDIVLSVRQISGDFGTVVQSSNDNTSEVDKSIAGMVNALSSLTMHDPITNAMVPSGQTHSPNGTHHDRGFLYYISSKDTRLALESSPVDSQQRVDYSDIGGLRSQIQALKELLELPLKRPELYSTMGVDRPGSVLLHGPSGTGKSLLASASITEAGLNCVSLSSTESSTRSSDETGVRVRNALMLARQRSPCCILVDDVDLLISSSRDSSTVDQSVVSALIYVLHEAPKLPHHVVVVATARNLDAVDPSLRRRFSCEVEVPVPNATDRTEILKKLFKGKRTSLADDEVQSVAYLSHGFVGADLHAMCQEACRLAVHRASHLHSVVDHGQPRGSITYGDLRAALQATRPSALASVLVDVPKVRWDDVGGQESVKSRLKEIVEWPMKHPEAFHRLGVSPPSGVLLYGPPGCSKTMLAKAVATESGFNFIAVKGPDLFDKYLGESEKALREIFRKARLASPSVIFVDEIDALGMRRGDGGAGGGGAADVTDRILAQLLTEMDGVEQQRGVIFIAATNRPDLIDGALLRPGRIDRLLYIPLPDTETRKAIFQLQFKRIPIDSSVSVDDLAAVTEWYSGAELCGLCREAAIDALQENIDAVVVAKRHFTHAIEQLQPRTDKDSIQFYKEFALSHQCR